MKQLILIVMGVSGCGKTTIGSLLAKELAIKFYDGDEFHPPDNISKMTRGIPLSDSDREEWLDGLRSLIISQIKKKEPIVLACSALKQSYRNYLQVSPLKTKFIFLKGDYKLISDRMTYRQNHYMKPSMLRSQFDTLEEPDDAITIDIADPPEVIIENILMSLGIDKYRMNKV
jgi:gluconokinase